MGEDWGTQFPQHLHWQSSNLDYLDYPINFGQQYTIPPFINPGIDMVSVKGMSPVNEALQPPHSSVDQVNEPYGWFYCFPRFRQAFTPASNSGFKGKLPTVPCENHKEAISHKLDSGCGPKTFLVFDQSGDQTTLIFGSGIGTPVKCFPPRGPNFTGTCNLKGEAPGTKENLNIHLGTIATEQYDNGTDLGSEMHEDTEELNALLYSDDDCDYSEDDEVTSTGHSPSTMTVHNKQDLFEVNREEVASTNSSAKKRKLFEGGYGDLAALMDTDSSVKCAKSLEYENDAESRCDNGTNCPSDEMGSESNNKKMRKERIRETVNILRNIIPCGKGKDAIVVIDEAINYLKSLKVKAKALGLDAP